MDQNCWKSIFLDLDAGTVLLDSLLIYLYIILQASVWTQYLGYFFLSQYLGFI